MQLKGKKILITGADGFIGSHLIERLLEEGAVVSAFCYYNSFNSWGWLDTLPEEKLKAIKIFTGDIRDAGSVKNCMKEIEVVFHLAALIGIPYSYYSPESYVDTNIKGTLNILQTAKEYGTSRVLTTSTSEVYGTANYIPIDEKHPRQGQSPYSASKIGADSITEAFYKSFNLPVTTVRPFNTYGPRQSSRAVIPTIITQLLNGEFAIKLGALHPTRDLLFVSDTVNGFVEIAKSDLCIGEEINIATQSEISVEMLANKLIQMINPAAYVVKDEQRLRPEKSEVDRLFGSIEKLKSLTAWKQDYQLEEGLKRTIEWFSNPSNLGRYKSNIYNV